MDKHLDEEDEPVCVEEEKDREENPIESDEGVELGDLWRAFVLSKDCIYDVWQYDKPGIEPAAHHAKESEDGEVFVGSASTDLAKLDKDICQVVQESDGGSDAHEVAEDEAEVE